MKTQNGYNIKSLFTSLSFNGNVFNNSMKLKGVRYTNGNYREHGNAGFCICRGDMPLPNGQYFLHLCRLNDTFSLLSSEPLFFTLMRHMAKTSKHKFISRIFCNVIAIGDMHLTTVYHSIHWFNANLWSWGFEDVLLYAVYSFLPAIALENVTRPSKRLFFSPSHCVLKARIGPSSSVNSSSAT